uniref:Nuclear receptor interacting protein 3 n=1 Tax=Leptobrachium leishanense TaxID=445787 RepID=A0A8C5QV58_9ANUR
MFYSGILTEGSKKETDLREAASLRQQRRMKQSVQFIHKDSADLLPLDGLKRLGTSKDTQPHNILQRRLLETNLSKIRSNRPAWPPKNEFPSPGNHLNHVKCERRGEDEDLIYVWCQCAGRGIKTLIDTSSQHNLISAALLDRLGLKDHFRSCRKEDGNLSLLHSAKPIGRAERLSVTLGTVTLDCTAMVIGTSPLCGKSYTTWLCVINLDKNQLEAGSSSREVVPFLPHTHNVKEER